MEPNGLEYDVADSLGPMGSMPKEGFSIDNPLPFPEVPFEGISRAAGQFEFGLGGRFSVNSGSVTRWGNSPIATAFVLDANGVEVRRVAVTMHDLSSTAPRPPADLSKIATMDSAGLAPGLYSIHFEARWAAIVHLSTSLFFSGGVLSISGQTVWGELFSPSPTSRQGIAKRQFPVLVG